MAFGLIKKMTDDRNLGRNGKHTVNLKTVQRMGLSLENDTTGEKSLKKTSSPLELADTSPTRKKTWREERKGRIGTINTIANSVIFSSILSSWQPRFELISASVMSLTFFDGIKQKILIWVFAIVSLNS